MVMKATHTTYINTDLPKTKKKKKRRRNNRRKKKPKKSGKRPKEGLVGRRQRDGE
jgi:hypothetical protein